MKTRMQTRIVAAMCVCLTVGVGTAEELGAGVPDLTKGGELTRINERWVGPVGIRCGSWRPVMRNAAQQEYVRQLLVLEVEAGSPAEGILEVGDVILGADGTGAESVPLFRSADWAMIPIADAITEAEAREPANLKLLRWRKDKTETVTIRLPTLGRYSDTAPYDCEKSKRILRAGIKKLYESNKSDKAGFAILCLLAADDPTSPENEMYQARAKEWAHNLEPIGNPWFSGPQLIALSEYYIKTKDESIFPKLVKMAEHHARGVSWFGTTGHKWADMQADGSPSGRLSGYGPINCSGALGFLGLSLAREAGVRSAVVESAIERQRIFFGHYAFKGALPYGEMPYAIGGSRGDNNGKCAMTGLALGLQDRQDEKAKYFIRMAALSSYSVRQYAHGGSYFGQVWHPIAAGQGGVKAAHMQFEEIRWHLDLKRRWDNSRIYDSSGNGYKDFAHEATALLFYALPLKQLYITGRGRENSLQFTDAEFDDLLFTKNFNPTQATTQELLGALSGSQGMLRGDAGAELARRIQEKPESAESAALIDQLLTAAADRKANPTGRAGACYALMATRNGADGPVGAFRNDQIATTMVALLKEADPYIRFAAVRVLQSLDPSALRPHVNEILDAVVATERQTFPLDEEDPLQWAHGEMGELLFKDFLDRSLDGVDRTKLLAAIRSLFKTPNASGRFNTSRVLDQLSMEEIQQLGDMIVDNMTVAAPGNAMGGSSTPACQEVMAKHLFEETVPLSVEYDIGSATKKSIPEKFGRSALTSEVMRSLGDLMLVQAVDVTGVIDSIMNNAGPGQLNKLKRIHSITAAEPGLKLPNAETELVVDATNYGVSGEKVTTYTWRKVYGPGKVSFTPNASSEGKKTTVSFTDQKPGKYRFEVTMSDTLGINVLRKTVDVTLLDRLGKLPANRPPTATSQTLSAVPGLPKAVVLSGTDPDGDDLGLLVAQHPAHGKLSGIGGDLTYTANYGFNGTDQFQFQAVDGQGQAATGTVDFKVSDQNVGVVVYEGFDYPSGALDGRGGSPSFGFAGPWTNTRAAKDVYLVADGSISYPDLPSTGGKLIQGGRGASPCRRPLDLKILSSHKLLDNGQELWFSVVIQGQKGRDKLLFGLRSGDDKDDADIGFGFDGPDLFATKDGKQAGRSRVGWSRTKQVMFPENAPNMIVGRCAWGKTDADHDTLEIYRVFDAPAFGPLILREPACVVEGVIPQAKIDSIYISGTAGGVDEIRVGPTLNSVMLGTMPLAARLEKPVSAK